MLLLKRLFELLKIQIVHMSERQKSYLQKNRNLREGAEIRYELTSTDYFL